MRTSGYAELLEATAHLGSRPYQFSISEGAGRVEYGCLVGILKSSSEQALRKIHFEDPRPPMGLLRYERTLGGERALQILHRNVDNRTLGLDRQCRGYSCCLAQSHARGHDSGRR